MYRCPRIRIQAVVNELRGEKIDVIRWSPDPATYIANALSPARVDAVRLIDTEERQAHVLVAEDQLSLAIGKEGQNVRLAARLTGWKIDIKDIANYDQEAEDLQLSELQAQKVDEDETAEIEQPELETPEASDASPESSGEALTEEFTAHADEEEVPEVEEAADTSEDVEE